VYEQKIANETRTVAGASTSAADPVWWSLNALERDCLVGPDNFARVDPKQIAF
jgi:hypothetical protein